jgi:uncharacterized protein YndB with AHSA1/START domain
MGHRIHLERRYAAPIEAVWAVVADHRGMSRWLAPGMRIRLEPQGSPTPDGVGAVRVIGRAGLAVAEEVLEFEPPRRLVYTVRSGFPLEDHRGVVVLSEDEGATRLTWTITFEPRYPGTGWLVVVIVRLVFLLGLTRLGRLLAAGK